MEEKIQMRDRYLAFMGLAPKRIPHWEHWSCPDAETYITGIDYYNHPRLCRLKMSEIYPQLNLPVPETDEPKPRPKTDSDTMSSTTDEKGYQHVRWGDNVTDIWERGRQFKNADDVFAFSPLKQADFTNIPVVESHNYTDEETVFQYYRRQFPPEWGDTAPKESAAASVGFYNTMFMWPLLTFGWELFLETCLDPRFERIMDEFAEINRRVFKVFSRLPVNFVICHDDIVNTKGPICSPKWMSRYIFPRYEEFWSIVKKQGKEVIFMSDGCMDSYVDDVLACGARGIITEPYTNFKPIAKKHTNCFLAGEGDVRILMRNNQTEIRSMVLNMVETAKITGGYMMCIGNHIPWNTPPEAIKYYLDSSAELAHR
ncbi:MAG: hypothetical protein M1501_01210 [Candidatus Omnitrophica bacterium]|nr:hypothetical protein [Candidatus Omnitrophota bacterium]